jgi:hypothetical protein
VGGGGQVYSNYTVASLSDLHEIFVPFLIFIMNYSPYIFRHDFRNL